MESIDLSQSNIRHLKTTQGNIIKIVMGVNKCAHHSSLLKALVIPAVDDTIMHNSQRRYKNIFKANTPARDLQSTL